MEENKQTQQQENGKVEKRFNESLKKVQAILGNPGWFKQPKVGQGDLPELLERLTATKKEELYRKFETAAIALVEKKLAYDKAVKQKQQEFNKAVEDKMKEFQNDMDAMFSLVDQIDNITKDYYTALSNIQDGTPPATVGKTSPGEGSDNPATPTV